MDQLRTRPGRRRVARRADRDRAGLAPTRRRRAKPAPRTPTCSRGRQPATDIDGAVLIAEHQTAGRGRHGRRMVGAARGHRSPCRSGVSAVDVPTEGWGWLPLATGVAVVDARDRAGRDRGAVGLKWPNDVLAGRPASWPASSPRCAPARSIVVGLGLNVTLAPEEVDGPGATSLLDLGVAGARPRHVWSARCCANWQAHRRLAGRARRRLGAGGRLPGAQPDPRLPVRAEPARRQGIVGTARAIDDQGRLCFEAGGQTAWPLGRRHRSHLRSRASKVPAWATRTMCWPATSRSSCTATRTGSD